MQIITKSIDEIVPYENNARKNDKAVKYVANSIKSFGFKVPIIIDKDNIIIAGHTRYKAAHKLNLKEVPCIMADDLTEEQVKAFRLADNKVAEYSRWDYDILENEIEELLSLDFNELSFEMSDFGFDFDFEERKQKEKTATQKRVEGILNLDKGNFIGVGKYDIPQIKAIRSDEIGEIKEWIGFNYVKSDKNPEGKAVHFFIDDYQFIRLWREPEKYMDKLAQYEAVLTPDFSPYSDMPLATQIFNHYRKHWIGAMMQKHGVKVIPTIRASKDDRSLDWYLDGEPVGGVVCISSMWTNTKHDIDYFIKKRI